jgi:CreA protein
MRRLRPALALLTLLALPASAQDAREIGFVNTAMTNLGLTRSHRVVVERFDDPLACAATGPVEVAAAARRGERGEQVYEASTSFFFKETRVHRFIDEQRNALVYLVWSTKLVDGSPYNAVAVVPIR